MIQSYNVDIAAKYGITEAVLIQTFASLLIEDKDNTEIHNGLHYRPIAAKTLLKLHPEFGNTKRILSTIGKLVSSDIISRGNFSTSLSNTYWYAFTDNGLSVVSDFLDIHADYEIN